MTLATIDGFARGRRREFVRRVCSNVTDDTDESAFEVDSHIHAAVEWPGPDELPPP